MEEACVEEEEEACSIITTASDGVLRCATSVSRSMRGLPLALPADLARCLVEIRLSSAQLVCVPPQLLDIDVSQLRCLDLSSNVIKVLPAVESWWASLTALKELDLSHNLLKAVPVSLACVPVLTTLNLRSNQLREWRVQCAPALCGLAHLAHLDLRYNPRLRELSEEGIRHELMKPHLEVRLGAEAGVPIRRGTHLTKVHPGDGPDGGWPELIAQLTPLSTPALLGRLQSYFAQKIDYADFGSSRDRLLELIIAEYEKTAVHKDVPLAHCRSEVPCEGIELPAAIYNSLLSALRENRWPEERERAKVESQSYLVLEKPPKGAPQESQGAKKSRWKREKYAVVWEAVSMYMQVVDPDFDFTGVALSRGFRGSPHSDNQDISYQWAMSLGDFDGGELCVESGPGEVSVVNTHGRPAKVDGRFPHWVAPWKGERYSVIVYKTRGEATPQREAVYPLRPLPR